MLGVGPSTRVQLELRDQLLKLGRTVNSNIWLASGGRGRSAQQLLEPSGRGLRWGFPARASMVFPASVLDRHSSIMQVASRRRLVPSSLSARGNQVILSSCRHCYNLG